MLVSVVMMMGSYLMVVVGMNMVMTVVMRSYLMVVTPPVLTLMAPWSHIIVDLQIFNGFLQLAYIVE